MKFKSKIGFLPFLIALLPLFTLLCNWIVYYFSHTKIESSYFINATICLIIGGLNIFLLFSFTYTITEKDLIVKGFLYKKTIPIASIYKIEEVRNLTFDPASSIDRIQVSYNKTEVLHVSPQKKQHFIYNLTQANRKILVKKQ